MNWNETARQTTLQDAVTAFLGRPDSDETPKQRRVYHYLSSIADAEGRVEISYPRIMRAVEIGRSYLSKTLQHYQGLNALQLVQRGWGNRATGSRDGKPNKYRITPQYADKFAEIKETPACPMGEDMLKVPHPAAADMLEADSVCNKVACPLGAAPINIIDIHIDSTVPYVVKPLDIVDVDPDPEEQPPKADMLDRPPQLPQCISYRACAYGDCTTQVADENSSDWQSKYCREEHRVWQEEGRTACLSVN